MKQADDWGKVVAFPKKYVQTTWNGHTPEEQTIEITPQLLLEQALGFISAALQLMDESANS